MSTLASSSSAKLSSNHADQQTRSDSTAFDKHIRCNLREWTTTLNTLKSIPSAVADKSMPEDILFFTASQALVDTEAALRSPAGPFKGQGSTFYGGYHPKARRVLVDVWKVCCGLVVGLSQCTPELLRGHLHIHV